MKTLVLYDSLYGNTEKIAKAIGEVFSDDVKVMRVTEVNPAELQNIDLLILGSPTHGGRPTKDVQALLNNQQFTLKGIKVAAFDTRGDSVITKIFGYAATRLAESLQKKGNILIGEPMGFIVKSTKGPLKDGETERAAAWGKEILKKMS